MRLSYDLHIHSCLSPCGDEDMLPSNIVGMAMIKGLDVIAVTDHCSCKNCPAVQAMSEQYGITALFGMELTTSEEVHVLCLFAELENAMRFDEYIESRRYDIKNRPEIFGEQLIVDADDNVIGKEDILLINATSVDFDEVYKLCGLFGGVMIPAHIDKPANSMLANLGFVPPESMFHCVELKHKGYFDKLAMEHQYLKQCNVISNSDAHRLEDINEPIHFLEAEANTPQAVLQALTKLNINRF